MSLPWELAEYPWECWEGCGFNGEGQDAAEHLREVHSYAPQAVEETIASWTGDFDYDDNGNVLDECREHGSYAIKYGCGPCDEPDRRYEESKEQYLV